MIGGDAPDGIGGKNIYIKKILLSTSQLSHFMLMSPYR